MFYIFIKFILSTATSTATTAVWCYMCHGNNIVFYKENKKKNKNSIENKNMFYIFL